LPLSHQRLRREDRDQGGPARAGSALAWWSARGRVRRPRRERRARARPRDDPRRRVIGQGLFRAVYVAAFLAVATTCVRADASSRQRTQITRLGGIASFPSWSPDGKQLSFYLYQAGAMDLWATTPGDSNAIPARLTRNLANEQNNQCTFACHSASWSPNGSTIALSDGDSARVLLI